MARSFPGSRRRRAKAFANLMKQPGEKEALVQSVKTDLLAGRRIKTETLANYLNVNLPKSEVWFQKSWREAGMKHEKDYFNCVFGPFIPDCHNGRYMYVIEIDGDVHRDPATQEKDKKKDLYFLRRGFRVFRIPAYNEEVFWRVVETVKEIRIRNERRRLEKKRQIKLEKLERKAVRHDPKRVELSAD